MLKFSADASLRITEVPASRLSGTQISDCRPENHEVGEIGQICSQESERHKSPGDITFFEALGLAAADFIYEKVLKLGMGR